MHNQRLKWVKKRIDVDVLHFFVMAFLSLDQITIKSLSVVPIPPINCNVHQLMFQEEIPNKHNDSFVCI